MAPPVPTAEASIDKSPLEVNSHPALAEGLKSNKTVKLLGLDNDVGEQGAEALAEMLKGNKTVKVLGALGFK
eukprot:symbB.v1.2.040432.t1/scaffold7228.1/size12512/1